MRKVMEEMLEGNFDFERKGYTKSGSEDGTLDFSYQNIEISLKKSESAEGSFTVYGPENGLVQGYIYSSNLRMECLDKEFIGVEEKIRYCFRSHGMEEGDVIEGQFLIISNYGEYELPFRVTIESNIVTSSLGAIKNMFHFTNLAKSNWEEAVKIFYSPNFKNIFTEGNDKQYYTSYKGLSAIYGNEQNVEEFLLEINKKQKIEYIPDKLEICIEDPHEISEHSISVLRNGWGHTFLKIKTDGDFLYIEKASVTDDDFLGNSYRLSFYVDSEKIHAGNNFGSIRIYNSYLEITVPVTVISNTDNRRMQSAGREKKRVLVQIMEYFEAFRSKKISTKTWMSETEKLIERAAAIDSKDINIKLFGVQLLITQERYNEAKWQLDRIKSEGALSGCKPEIKCYFLYLTSLCSRDAVYVDEVTAKVEHMYHENKDNWKIAWLLMYLSEEYGRSLKKRWQILEQQFMYHCSSPVIYVEAWHLMERNPTFLAKLDLFEIQVLNYAVKKDLLTEGVIVQLRHLIPKRKDFSNRIFIILKECYEKYPDKETLSAICTLLIKGNKTAGRYFKWYSMGVEQELRITKLYEYYMMSLPLDYEDTLPKMILMYFAYHSELDYRKKAFLYAYIYKNREEQPELYISYCEQMEHFVLEQIHRGKINKELAYLYKYIINTRLINDEIADELATLLFTNRITTKNSEMKNVVVCYSLSKKEEKFSIHEGVAMVPLYGIDYKIFLEDGEGNRFSSSIVYTVERMILPGKIADMISPFVTEHMGMDIYVCEGNKSFITVNQDNVMRFRHMAASGYLEEQIRNEIRLKLVHYYYEQDYIRELDGYLMELEPEEIGKKERNEILRFMVTRGMHDKALEWIKSFGVEEMDVKTIVRLCSRIIARDGYLEEEKFTYIVYYAFLKGKYDTNLISYLVRFYNGSVKQMRDIWKAATAFEAESYEICERIIVQMMFSDSFIGEKIEVFKSYVAGGAKTPIEEAFLAQCSYDYFVNDNLTEPFVFTDLLRVYERGKQINLICKLAFLKYYAANKVGINGQIKMASRLFLYDVMEENIYFPFFKEYVSEIPALARFADKTMIEYKAHPGSKTIIHYIIERGIFTESEYKMEEMRDMYGGICVKSFVLFFGEKLQYYISEECDGKEQLTESGAISKSDIVQDVVEDKFSMLNDIMIGKTLQDYNTVDCLLEEYYRKEYMVSQIFRMK